MWIVAAALAVGAPIARSQGLGANFLYPLNGQQNVSTVKPFQWSSPPGALRYRLYVGTTTGGNDLADSREISATSFSVPALPLNSTLYARIWTNTGANGWVSQDVSFTAAPGPAAFVYPVNGQQNVNTAKPFQWSSPPGALRYRLYVGTTPGGNDLADSREISATSFSVPALPVDRTLYARIWTNTGAVNGWVSQDISFSAAPGPAAFVYPVNGQQSVSTAKPFQWGSPPGALRYRLYVGTTPGSNDLADSREISATSFSVPALPLNRTLYARIWTNTGAVNGWVSQDVNFTAAPGPATFVYPINGQQNVSTAKPFQWSSPPGALRYRLYIGTTPGGNDLADSYETQNTTFSVPALPVGQTLYGRIWTNTGNGWVSNDISFTAAPGPASFLYPLNGQQNVNMSRPIRWSSAPGALAYRLYVGTTLGANDLADSRETQNTLFAVPTLPVGKTIYARIWTDTGYGWMSKDIAFTAAASPVTFIYPATRSIGIVASVPFRWSAAAQVGSAAAAYRLTIGFSPETNDLFDSGQIQQTTYQVPASALPPGKTFYARVTARFGNGQVLPAYTVFQTAGGLLPVAQMVYPTNGDLNVDLSRPFQWRASDVVEAYQLKIFCGGLQVRDSGEIRVPRYFAEDLTAGTYTAQINTKIGGSWYSSDFAFSVTHTGAAASTEIAAALWTVDFVRRMADFNNNTYPWTDLWNRTGTRWWALCSDYRDSLLAVLSQMNVESLLPLAQRPRRLDLEFNGYETHTLVEFWDTDAQSWVLLDPTFDVSMKRSSDGGWATKEDIHNATLSSDWTAISYQSLGSYGFAIAKVYYIDYPLLFLNIPPLPALGAERNPVPYLIKVRAPSGQPAIYAVQCFTLS